MCGFVGFISSRNYENEEEILKNMTDTIKHRGPDDVDYYIDEICLGFRRLSIIDLKLGRQPLFNEDKTKILVFNGEIYNYIALRKDLIEKGHTFTTKTDSEVIVHGYEEYGVEFINKMRGMFSFVLWDKLNSELFGARDYFGIKPLYYTKMNDTFMFGSEIKSFIPHPDFKKELNQAAMEQYLSFQYSPGCETFFSNVYKVPPAHYFTFKDGRIQMTCYWKPEFNAADEKSIEDWTDDIERVLDDSIEAHKISDVGVGAFLSSGVDSSYIACSANVDTTFTVGFGNGTRYNEINYAQDLSKLIGVQNKSKVISAEEFWHNIPKIQYHMDEPLADPSAIALYFLSKLASNDYKVILSGEGADEIFGGYNIYKEPLTLKAYDLIPFPIRKAIGRTAALFPNRRGLNFLIRRGKKLEDKFIGNAYIFSYKERNKLLKKSIGAPSPSAFTKPYYEKVKDKDPVTKMQFLDINLWLTGDILLKADKMSMANSLELRVPYLDKEVMRLAGKIPLKYRVNKHNTKYAFRQAAARRLPAKWSEKKKLGFPVPIRVWLTEEEYYQRIKKEFLSNTSQEFFNTDLLLILLEQHKSGKRDNSRKIWTIYTFLIWYKVYFQNEAMQ